MYISRLFSGGVFLLNYLLIQQFQKTSHLKIDVTFHISADNIRCGALTECQQATLYGSFYAGVSKEVEKVHREHLAVIQ
jgi:hypothetical protein